MYLIDDYMINPAHIVAIRYIETTTPKKLYIFIDGEQDDHFFVPYSNGVCTITRPEATIAWQRLRADAYDLLHVTQDMEERL